MWEGYSARRGNQALNLSPSHPAVTPGAVRQLNQQLSTDPRCSPSSAGVVGGGGAAGPEKGPPSPPPPSPHLLESYGRQASAPSGVGATSGGGGPPSPQQTQQDPHPGSSIGPPIHTSQVPVAVDVDASGPFGTASFLAASLAAAAGDVGCVAPPSASVASSIPEGGSAAAGAGTLAGRGMGGVDLSVPGGAPRQSSAGTGLGVTSGISSGGLSHSSGQATVSPTGIPMITIPPSPLSVSALGGFSGWIHPTPNTPSGSSATAAATPAPSSLPFYPPSAVGVASLSSRPPYGELPEVRGRSG